MERQEEERRIEAKEAQEPESFLLMISGAHCDAKVTLWPLQNLSIFSVKQMAVYPTL